MSCKAGLKILIALALIFAELPRLSVYLIEEAFTVLLGIAVMHILVLLAVISCLLLWEGARLVFLRLKGIDGKITSTRHRPLRAGRAMSHAIPDH